LISHFPRFWFLIKVNLPNVCGSMPVIGAFPSMLFLLYLCTFLFLLVFLTESLLCRSAGCCDQRCSLLLGFCLPLAAHRLTKIPPALMMANEGALEAAPAISIMF